MKCCFCGPVKNCGKYLPKVLSNIEQLGQLFDDYHIFIYYDKSHDNSLQVLKSFQTKNPNKLTIHINEVFQSPFRTHRLAYGRNICLDYIKQQNEIYIENPFDYFIMMDFDDVNCKHVKPHILKKYLSPEHITLWEALSFNTYPAYYDIWALSIYPFCFSYNHFTNNRYHNYHTIQDYVSRRLASINVNVSNNNSLLRCLSSFNGFAIYKVELFFKHNCKYDGTIRLDLLPMKMLQAHKKASNGHLIFKDYGHVKGAFEDCEHRAFHLDAINKFDAKIMISPEILFISNNYV
uniref:Glycosyltransferase 2-like domain-containing protein n=1 Tax=viral metagenome TaxID=1070528 RepID=A0A6C0IRW7_9ZZZZ